MGHYGSGKVCCKINSIYVLQIYIAQTVLGRLICQKEAILNNRKKVIYVVFSKNSHGLELQQRFKSEFRNENDINIQTYSRQECCEKYHVEDSDDNIFVIENIVKQVEEDTIIMFDECPMERKMKLWGNDYDWKDLRNTGKNVTLVVCLQPIMMEPTSHSAPSDVLGPRNASVVLLSNQYRNSKHILTLVNSLCRSWVGGCRYNKMDGEAGHDVDGPEVTAVYLNNELAVSVLQIWLDMQLRKLGALDSQVKVIHDRHSLDMARKCFTSSPPLTSLEEFQGCEVPVAVVMFSKDSSAHLLELCARAQFKLFLVISDNQRLWDNLPGMYDNNS
jgi:hypothetical protein